MKKNLPSPAKFERHANKKMSRIVIYPKDIQSLTGKSYRQALSLNKEIRKYLQKKKHQLVTIYEFADYIGIKPEDVFSHLPQ